eukprot:TRINITY_DN494_c1_g1_i4.p2 TRINITY_DN494_c1_g1~~TRINITY_DN494_c1_g1_i4.p2  ORF type:complete len:104 (-),score=6.97 TRINITY_DN494_c1_g1_i4:794-1105(-)
MDAFFVVFSWLELLVDGFIWCHDCVAIHMMTESRLYPVNAEISMTSMSWLQLSCISWMLKKLSMNPFGIFDSRSILFSSSNTFLFWFSSADRTVNSSRADSAN